MLMLDLSFCGRLQVIPSQTILREWGLLENSFQAHTYKYFMQIEKAGALLSEQVKSGRTFSGPHFTKSPVGVVFGSGLPC